jgi:sugar lactone lactonase YvrE
LIKGFTFDTQTKTVLQSQIQLFVMNKAGRIISIRPEFAVPGGELTIECEGFDLNRGRDYACYVGGGDCRLPVASADRILAVVPERVAYDPTLVQLVSGGESSEPVEISIGRRLVDDMHIVANPAVDPADGSIVLTRSGSRGQQLGATLFRYEADGFLDQVPLEITTPTGVAFGPSGELYVTNRTDGELYRLEHDEEAITVASGLGVATGIAFNSEGSLFVGDRGGTIYRIDDLGRPETFAILEASVAAYHMAFGQDGNLYVTAPALASHDAVYVIDEDGYVDKFFRGFGRPQGLAFDTEGNLYVAACYKGKHGIVKIDPSGEHAETVVAGTNIVGLCFTREGDMIVATNAAIYSISTGIFGKLLN